MAAERHRDEATRLLPAARPVRDVRHVLRRVYEALAEKGLSPTRQIAGYLLSGDPAYITTHRDARTLIRAVPREELLEELVRDFLLRQGELP